jgi:hypothetical protein
MQLPPELRQMLEPGRLLCWNTANSGPLAQLVEQWTLNPLVVGSIPTRPTKISPHSCGFFIFLQMLVQPDLAADERKIGGAKTLRTPLYFAAVLAGLAAGWCSRAKVAELVDALALGASGATRESSSLFFRIPAGMQPPFAQYKWALTRFLRMLWFTGRQLENEVMKWKYLWKTQGDWGDA